jgi:hypothetical protein
MTLSDAKAPFIFCFNWIRINIKFILSFSLLILTFALIFIFQNKKIKDLKIEMLLLITKCKIEKIAAENNILIKELPKLKEKDQGIKEKIEKIESSLKEKLEENMSLEETLEKFRIVGLY